MNNDLISREALKETMQNREECKECTDIDCISCFYEIIDNAPAVNPFTDNIWEAYSKIMDMEFEHSNEFWIMTPKGKKIYFEKKRPEGEWIIVRDEKWGDNVKCPFCGKELAGTDLNFCCRCGAKLIGSEKMNGGEE